MVLELSPTAKMTYMKPNPLDGNKSVSQQTMLLDLNCERAGYSFSEALETKLQRYSGLLLHETFEAPDDKTKHVLIGSHLIHSVREHVNGEIQGCSVPKYKQEELEEVMPIFMRILNTPGFWEQVRDYHIVPINGKMVAPSGYTGFAVIDNQSDFLFLVNCGREWIVPATCLNKKDSHLIVSKDQIPIAIVDDNRFHSGWDNNPNIIKNDYPSMPLL